MIRIDYEGPLRDVGGEIHPVLERLLATRDLLLVLRHGTEPYRVVVGVPHHTSEGVSRICERRRDPQGQPHPRVSDEEAARYALIAFEALCEKDVPSKMVIMAHATTHDPNKHTGSPYTQALFEEEVHLLLECHGSGPRRSLPLELSAGRNNLADPLRFGRPLADALGQRHTLGVQAKAGTCEALILRTDGTEEPGRLRLAARRTRSLVEAERQGVEALHLEAKPRFRVPVTSRGDPPPDGFLLGQALGQTVVEYLDSA